MSLISLLTYTNLELSMLYIIGVIRNENQHVATAEVDDTGARYTSGIHGKSLSEWWREGLETDALYKFDS